MRAELKENTTYLTNDGRSVRAIKECSNYPPNKVVYLDTGGVASVGKDWVIGYSDKYIVKEVDEVVEKPSLNLELYGTYENKYGRRYRVIYIGEGNNPVDAVCLSTGEMYKFTSDGKLLKGFDLCEDLVREHFFSKFNKAILKFTVNILQFIESTANKYRTILTTK